MLECQPYETTLGSLKKRALYIMQLLTQDTKSGVIVWPFFLEFIPNPNMSPGVSHILKAINNYIQKYKEQFGSYPDIKPKYQSKIPKIQTILARLMILLKIPNFFPNLGVEIINSMQNILEVYIQQPVSNELMVVIKDLKFTINQPNSQERYEELLHMLWTKILDHFKSNEWFQLMHEDMIAVQDQYKAKSEQLLGHLIKMHGQLLTKLHNKETIKYQIDKFFQVVHNDFSGMQLNLNIQPIQVSKQLRMQVAEALGYICVKYLDLVVEKIRNILNCEVVQKKQQGGFGSGLLGVFKRQEGADERFQDMQITILLIFGQICVKVDPVQLGSKIESSIINNVTGYFEKPNEQVQQSVQFVILKISKSLEDMLENMEDKNDILKIVENSRSKFIQISKKNFAVKKNQELKMLAWNSMSSLLRLQPALEYCQYLSFLTECLQTIPEINDQSRQIYQEPLSNIFLAFIFHKEIQKSEEEINALKSDEDEEVQKSVSCYERLALIINTIDRNEKSIEQLQFFFESFLQAVMNFKEKITDRKDKKYVIQSFSVLLSHIFKGQTDLSRICLLCLEKILIGFGIYPNVQMRNYDEFNQDFVSQVSHKINFDEINMLVDENVQKCQNQDNIEVIRGFLSFTRAVYEHFLDRLEEEKIIEKCFTNFKILYESIKNSGQSTNDDEEKVLQTIQKIMEKYLHSSLNILLSENCVYPITDFLKIIFRRISKTKHLLFKSFNHFTDIINNPEDIISQEIGNMMTNSIMFIGYILDFSEDLLKNLANKFFFHIFGTFLLRFATSFDYSYRPVQTDELKTNPSKITLWSLEMFIKHTEKKHLLEDFSQGLMLKLITENQFEDGISELIMILCKNSTLKEINQLLEFLKPFIDKKIEKQRRLCFLVMAQLISSSHFTTDFYDDKYKEKEKQYIQNWYEYLIETMLNNSTDVSEYIETIYRGIGNITYLLKYNIAKNEEIIVQQGNNDQLQEKNASSKANSRKSSNENQGDDGEEKKDEENHQLKAGTFDLNQINDLENENPLQESQAPTHEAYFVIHNQTYGHILETLFVGLDDSYEQCIAGALNSLQNIIDFINQDFASKFVINLMLKVSTSFEKPHVKLRLTAFNLFGKLVENFGKGEEFEDFSQNQLHVALISIIVHLNDENLQVRSVCKLTLERVGKSINQPQFLEMLDNTNNSQNQPELKQFEVSEKLMVSLLNYLIQDNNEKISLYTDCLLEFSKAPEDNIQCVAFIGLMYIMAKLNKFDFDKNQIQKIRQRFDQILEQNTNKSLNDALLKGVYFMAQDEI